MRVRKVFGLMFLALLLSSSVSAQFRSLMDKANKEYQLHAYNAAIQTYKDALRLRADSPEALGNLADSYRQINDMMEAAKYYVRAVAQRGVEARHVLNYAHVLKALGRYDEAKRYYLEYAKDDPVVGNHYAQTCDFARSQQQLNTGLTVNNENKINSPSSDFGPAFFRGQVVFSSSRVDIQRSGGQGFTGSQGNQLFIAKIGADGLLESPYFLRSAAQQNANRGPVAYSPDGRLVAFTRNNFVNGTRHIPSAGMELSLFLAEINNNGDWVNEQPFPYNLTGFSTGFPAFSPDGNALYFASNRNESGSFGGYDIYVSYRTGNTWGRPENLGPVINSPGNELTPFFDGENLFFASDWHPGFGGFDIFRAEQLNNRWMQIFHLGAPVSSPRDDYGMIYDRMRNVGYFTSNREGGRGFEDLYSLSRPGESLILSIRSAADGAPVDNALVDLSGCGYGIQQADARGILRLQAPGGLNCTALVRAPGYSDQSVQLSALPQQQGNRQIDVQLVRPGEYYYGKVLNYSNRMPLEGVTIAAVNQQTGNTIQTLTDQNGDYALALSTNAGYQIRYSRPGFRDINRSIRVLPGNDPSLLGSISLLSVDSPLPINNNPVVDVFEPQKDVLDAKGIVKKGFAVQVAALRKPNTDAFARLGSYGEVYTKNENSVYKVRVGVFPTQTQAQQALAEIKRSGYAQAFIVAEDGAEFQEKKGNEFNPPVNPSAANSRYKIQLGAYRDVRNFNGASIQNLGVIEDGRKGDLTIKYLSGFQTLEQARRARQSAVAAGFPQAFILEVGSNGQMNRVQ